MINDYKERETCAHAHAFPEHTRRIWWDCVQDNRTNPTSRKWAFLKLTPQNPPIYWSWKGRRVAADLNKHWKSQYRVYLPVLNLDHIWWVYLYSICFYYCLWFEIWTIKYNNLRYFTTSNSAENMIDDFKKGMNLCLNIIILL